MEIAENTRKSYKEVYRIIENSTEEIQNKISVQFKNFLKSSMLNIDYRYKQVLIILMVERENYGIRTSERNSKKN